MGCAVQTASRIRSAALVLRASFWVLKVPLRSYRLHKYTNESRMSTRDSREIDVPNTFGVSMIDDKIVYQFGYGKFLLRDGRFAAVALCSVVVLAVTPSVSTEIC